MVPLDPARRDEHRRDSVRRVARTAARARDRRRRARDDLRRARERVRRLASVLGGAASGAAIGSRWRREPRGDARGLARGRAARRDRRVSELAARAGRARALRRARRAPLAIASPRHAEADTAGAPVLVLGDDYERQLAARRIRPPRRRPRSTPRIRCLILYTSGTTGLPKGAAISHRAEIVRNLVTRAEFGVAQDDTFVAWSPLYHMGAVDNSLGTLMAGGTVIVVDGFDAARLADVVATRAARLAAAHARHGRPVRRRARAPRRHPRGVKLCGVMADLVPPAEIARITTLLGAPYANTFGATETGCPPCSSNLIPIGVAPRSLAKEQSPFCEVRLVDRRRPRRPRRRARASSRCAGRRCSAATGTRPRPTPHDFRGGWFHMGDVFVRNPDGTLDFVDRVQVPDQDRRREHLPRRDRARAARRSARRRGRVVRRRDATGARCRSRSSRAATTRSPKARCSRCAAPSSPATSSRRRSGSSPYDRVPAQRVGQGPAPRARERD